MNAAVLEANSHLKAIGCRIRLWQRADGHSLQLQGTLPPKPGNGKDKPHQQRISLRAITGFDVMPNTQGIQRAIAEAKRIDNLLYLNQFDWSEFLVKVPSPTDGPLVMEAVAKFEQWFFNVRRPTPSRATTWNADYLSVFKVLPNEPLTQDLIEQITIAKTQPDSRQRKRYVMALRKLAEFMDVPLQKRRLKELEGNYDYLAKERQPLSDQEIIELYDGIRSERVRIMFGYLAVFGIRNHEVYHLDNSNLLEGGNTIRVLASTKKQHERDAYAFPESWISRFQLKVDLKDPELFLIPDADNKTLGGRISHLFRQNKLPSPYNLRYSWRHRAIEKGLDPSVAAESLGHSVHVSQKHYTRFLRKETMVEQMSRVNY